MIDIVQVKEMCSKEKWEAYVKRNPLTDTECIYLKNEIGECVIIGEIPKAEPTSSKMEQVQITDKAPIIDKCPIEWDSEEDSVYDRGDKQ